MLESEDIDGDLEEVNSASGDNTGDEEVAATGATEKSEEEKQKPKKKSIIVWQCLNPECTVTSKRVLRYYIYIYYYNLCQPICLISIFQYCNTFRSLLLWVGRQGWKKKKGRCLK